MKWVVLVLIGVWCLAIASPALAFVPRAGNVIVVSEPIQDDVYLSGGTVGVVGAIDGDLAAVGGTLTLAGPVTGSILAAGGTLMIEGPIGRTLRAAGGTLRVASRITGDAVLAGGNIEVAQTAEVGRDLVAAGGTIALWGSVKRNALLSGGRILIRGTIQGDADVRGNQVVIEKGARIEGKLRYTADAEAEIQPGAQVSGGVERLLPPLRQRPSWVINLWPFAIVGHVLEALWLLAFGFIAMALTPRTVLQGAERIRLQFGLSLLTGFVLLVVVPVGAGLLVVTLLGIPLGVVVLLLYLATLYPGLIFTAVALGEYIIRGWQWGPARRASPYFVVTVGTVGLALLFAIPWLGWIVRFLAVLVGFGAFWATMWATRRSAQLTAPGQL